MAGAIPGILLATFYAIYVLARVNLNPAMAPTAAEVAEARGTVGVIEREDNGRGAVFSYFLRNGINLWWNCNRY